MKQLNIISLDEDKVLIGFKKLREDAIIPSYAHEGDSGMDIRIPENYSSSTLLIHPGERLLVKTGLKMRFDPSIEAQIRSKSGLTYKKGLIVLNSPGTIEFNYQGELGVILYNASNEPIELMNGMAIAQVVFCPVINSVNSEVIIQDDFEDDEVTSRGTGGFGSTGLFKK